MHGWTALSAIKYRFGPAVRPSAWYRQFRELVLTVAVYNLEQALKDDRYIIRRFNGVHCSNLSKQG